jgi:hypothetical protein
VDKYQGCIDDVSQRDGHVEVRSAYVAPIVHVLRVPSGRDRSIGRNAAVNRVDASEGVDVHLQVGQGDIGARLERCSIAFGGWVKEVDGGKNSVGIDSRATTASIGSNVTAGGVFVGLSGRSGRESRRMMCEK